MSTTTVGPIRSAADVDYDGRCFAPLEDGQTDRRAHYRQRGDLLWGEFSGGRARRGSLAGRRAGDGSLDFAYCMVLDGGEVISGHCHSVPERLPDGRIRLHETWERYGRHSASGESWLEEVRS